MMEIGLVGALSGIAAGRVSPILEQDGLLPAVRYQLISTDRENGIEGVNLGPTEYSVQIDCVASTYESAREVSDQVRVVLDGYKGAWGDDVCRFIKIRAENAFYEQDGDDITHFVSQRYSIWTNND